jgi:hypothetical protein
MKLDSIKTRLLTIISVCLLGMLILVVNQVYNTKRLVNLNQQSKTLLSLSNELLQLRRHEKDFLLRMDPSYITRFETRADNFSIKIQQIKAYFDEFAQSHSLFNELHTSFELYRHQFLDLVALQNEIGLDENHGFQNQFRQATHLIEVELKAQNQLRMQLLLLQIRQNEKDFLLAKRMEYVSQEQHYYLQLLAAVEQSKASNKPQLQALLEDYQQGFMSIVAAHQTMGLDHNSGLQGQFREQAHELEAQLLAVTSQFELLISEAEFQVERNSLLIMLITSLALITLLVRSYVTFQRAFLNFVMFFYRCKREYQHMDSKKMGFSEFKHLATIANEMIDARRDIERQLLAANAHIAKLEKDSVTDLKHQTLA